MGEVRPLLNHIKEWRLDDLELCRWSQFRTANGSHGAKSKSPATKKKKRTEITPFIVKKAALSLERSSDGDERMLVNKKDSN